MSLEDRFRQAFDDAVAEIRTRLESEFTATLTDVRAEADRDKAEALAALDAAKAAELAAADEARTSALAAAEEAKATALAAAEEAQAVALAHAKGSVESELLTAFQSEKAALTSTHDIVIAQLREAVESDRSRLLDEAAAEAARLLDEADAAAATAKAELDQTQTEAARQREELETALTQARHDGTLAVEKAKADAEADLARVRSEHEAAFTTVCAEAQEAAAAFSQAVEAQLAVAIRLLESVRALDGATSLTEVLDTLTFSAAKEAGRAAILVVKGDRLLGWRTAGFGTLDGEPRSIESSTADVGALAAAVNTSRPAVVGSGSVLAAPAFSQLPPDRPGLAVPLLVAGRPVAVLYADTGDATPASSAWTSPVEVLVRHAGRCLEAMTVSRGAHARATATRVGTPA